MKKRTLTLLATGLLLLLGAGFAQAQTLYRIVGADGKVTFSDTPPPAGNAKAKSGGASTGPANTGSALPYELQQIVSRYPVTLYTGDACGPCGSGRNFLNSRGIPFAERTVSTSEDAAALQRLSGDTSLPFLTVGGQQIKGYSDAEWGQFLDAAGYPKTSQLPSGYRAPAATPLVAVQRPAAGTAGTPANQGTTSGEPGIDTVNTRPRPVPTPRPATDPNPAGIRF